MKGAVWACILAMLATPLLFLVPPVSAPPAPSPWVVIRAKPFPLGPQPSPAPSTLLWEDEPWLRPSPPRRK